MAGYVVALTGGIASGKSEVERRFANHGIAIVDADRIARELVEPGQAALAEIVATFGAGVLAADGRLDRRALRQQVFIDPAARRRLESILHPRIRTEMKARAVRAEGDYVVLAIPLLAENPGAYGWVDRVLIVDVPRDVQIQRLIQRDGITLELAEAMLAAQASREQRLAIADDIIDNSGPREALDATVAILHQRYRDLSVAT